MKKWIENSWLGKKVHEIWRSLFNDETGVSMRKIGAGFFMNVMGGLAIAHTNSENLVYVLGVFSSLVTALLGLVLYGNIKKDEKNSMVADNDSDVTK